MNIVEIESHVNRCGGCYIRAQVIGDGLRSHTDEHRATEVEVAVHALNHMLRLGRPSYVRIG